MVHLGVLMCWLFGRLGGVQARSSREGEPLLVWVETASWAGRGIAWQSSSVQIFQHRMLTFHSLPHNRWLRQQQCPPRARPERRRSGRRERCGYTLLHLLAIILLTLLFLSL